MTGFELSGTQVIVLMAAGGVFAAFALYLMARPPSHGAARLELFGLKFEASSAAILVFLVGAGLLSIPIWVNERAPKTDINRSSDARDGSNRALILPDGPETREVEPNDSISTANQLEVGSAVGGKTQSREADWFVVPTADVTNEAIELMLVNLAGAWTSANIYNDRREFLGEYTSYEGADYWTIDVEESERLYFKVVGGGTSYELRVSRN